MNLTPFESSGAIVAGAKFKIDAAKAASVVAKPETNQPLAPGTGSLAAHSADAIINSAEQTFSENPFGQRITLTPIGDGSATTSAMFNLRDEGLLRNPFGNPGDICVQCHGVSGGGFSGNVNDFAITALGVSPSTAARYQSFANGLQKYGPPVLVGTTAAVVGATGTVAFAEFIAFHGAAAGPVTSPLMHFAGPGAVGFGGFFTFEQSLSATSALLMRSTATGAIGTGIFWLGSSRGQNVVDFFSEFFGSSGPATMPSSTAGLAGAATAMAKDGADTP